MLGVAHARLPTIGGKDWSGCGFELAPLVGKWQPEAQAQSPNLWVEVLTLGISESGNSQIAPT